MIVVLTGRCLRCGNNYIAEICSLMGCLIFRLQYVTEEEAEEVRHLFATNDIGIYETGHGFFGTSVAGFWLENDDQKTLARSLLKDYGQRRFQRVRDEFAVKRQQGQVETLWQRCKNQPLKIAFALMAIVGILAFSLLPFVGFFN